MKVTYLEKPVAYRLPNNIVDFNAYRKAHLPALPAPVSPEPLPTLHLTEEEPPTFFQLYGQALDALASVALTVAAVVVMFSTLL
ncbi:MAG: hypothetical protein MJ077_00780 [Oscillospiraceae bacterium]|nr:hypothetical protein [Oscillospiraceae bacterium]